VRYDLTAYFTDTALETLDDGFIPDVMLLNENGERVYVEIAVTHTSTEKKQESGYRIIELSVENETDLEIIKTRLLSETDERVDLIGFHAKPMRGEFPDECVKTRCVFYLWLSGKAYMETSTVAAFRERYLDERQRFYFTFTSRARATSFVEALERAYLQGLDAKNCYLCRYHGTPNHDQRMADHNPIFCKFLQKTCSSNHAAECEYYRPDTAVFRAYSPLGPCDAEGGEDQEHTVSAKARKAKPFLPSRGMRAFLKHKRGSGRRRADGSQGARRSGQ
jgi:hypothetical protein